MLEETLAWEHPKDPQCFYAPLGVCLLAMCSGFCTGSAGKFKKKLIRSFRNTLESFSKLLQLLFGTPAFYLSLFMVL